MIAIEFDRIVFKASNIVYCHDGDARRHSRLMENVEMLILVPAWNCLAGLNPVGGHFRYLMNHWRCKLHPPIYILTRHLSSFSQDNDYPYRI